MRVRVRARHVAAVVHVGDLLLDSLLDQYDRPAVGTPAPRLVRARGRARARVRDRARDKARDKARDRAGDGASDRVRASTSVFCFFLCAGEIQGDLGRSREI